MSLGMSSNGLTDTIPPETDELTALRRLGLPANELTGPIPPELGKLRNLWAAQGTGGAARGRCPATRDRRPGLARMVRPGKVVPAFLAEMVLRSPVGALGRWPSGGEGLDEVAGPTDSSAYADSRKLPCHDA